MNLLKEGIETHVVEKTALTRKLTIDGITKPYPVYRVRLDCLFYNDQNDRIATWISKYRAQHNGESPSPDDSEEYNRIIEGFIVESNPDAIKRTQNNIEMVDQREPGVVLVDGRIIDGNRRFTCLRRLAEKNDRFHYFETVILDRDIENNAKQIKMLELSIQHGEESKVDYNPVDRLVGIYHDIVETHLISEEEYAKATNESVADVKKRIEVAKLMIEFLEFINASKQFFIARDLQITFPLEELSKILKKCRTEEEAEDLKISVFMNILMQTSGDLTRFIRSFKNIVGSDYQDEFLSNQRELAEEVVAILPPQGVTTESIREIIKANDSLSQEINGSVEKAQAKVKKTETRNRPIQQAEKATALLEDIDTNIFAKMNDSELMRLKRQMNKLEASIATIKEILNG